MSVSVGEWIGVEPPRATVSVIDYMRMINGYQIPVHQTSHTRTTSKMQRKNPAMEYEPPILLMMP